MAQITAQVYQLGVRIDEAIKRLDAELGSLQAQLTAVQALAKENNAPEDDTAAIAHHAARIELFERTIQGVKPQVNEDVSIVIEQAAAPRPKAAR